jgi:ABC-type uncharacterized transport system YnjBCD permease subunit
MNQAMWQVVIDSHKYWYDILMGFKTELLVAYLATLIALVVVIAMRNDSLYKRLDDATTHEENMAEIANERLRIEKSDASPKEEAE